MSRSSRRKGKYGNTSEFSQDGCNEGTAARTRPFSFDEIMVRRKNKKQSGDVEEVPGGAGNFSGKSIVEKVSDYVGSDRYRHIDSVASGVKYASQDFKVSYRKKEDNSSMKERKLVKRKAKESREIKSKLKDAPSKSSSGNKANKGGKTDKWIHGKRKNDECSSEDLENESEKRHSRDFVVKVKYADRNRGKSEKECKRKDRNEDDERTRERNAGKKHVSDFSDRKEKKEPSQFRHEDSRQKRRRSRSREHDKDRGKRSISLSPRAHKRTSYDVREHGELSSHSLQERSGRLHSDVDRKRISNNGLITHHRRHGGSASRLGGYSPRKRRTEAAIKTPSPTSRSPEKKSAGWDLPPVGKESSFSDSVLSNLESLNQTVSANTHELFSVVPITSNTPKPVVGIVSSAPSSKMNASVDSIQLTQATRPMRRLYVENLPASTSEEAVMECLNNFLLSSGVNLIQSTQPCISCIINKEKGQALVEFLTPEDASAALSFDGRSFSGSILKIRRPKDFVEVPVRMTGVPEKSVAVVESVSNIVQDSHHKIFIGGISKGISSEMLMEIASTFGPLKAYRFEVNADLNEPCAFLEYVDQSVTLKACVGLNGMRLGGQVLTVVQAIPKASLSVESIGNSPSYGIPEHAKPLLKKPTQVLKLKNLLDPNCLSSLSEPELDEILEDIRLECARFGTVKSVNVVKLSDCCTTLEGCEVNDITGSAMDDHNLTCNDNKTSAEILGEGMDRDDSRGVGSSERSSSAKEVQKVNTAVEGTLGSGSEPSSTAREPEEAANKAVEGGSICDGRPADNLVKDEICEPAVVLEKSSVISREIPNAWMDQLECHDQNVADITKTGDLDMEDRPPSVKEELISEEDNKELVVAFSDMDSNSKGEEDKEKDSSDEGDVLEAGCVLVEYKRAEASSMAAHCLHGRLFDDRIVMVGFVAHDLYRARFLK